jgi:uncharacterized cupredoxin-like copper-binding protein
VHRDDGSRVRIGNPAAPSTKAKAEVQVIKPTKGTESIERSTVMSRARLAVVAFLLTAAAAIAAASAHEDHGTYSAGEPGDPKKPARVVLVTMREADGKMMFVPDKVEVRKGEQIRFVLRNGGALEHEFVLATTEENAKHAEEMKKNPDMEHDDPNGKRLKPKGAAEILWRFTKAGTFEYGCLIPGHREAGMTGTIIVK